MIIAIDNWDENMDVIFGGEIIIEEVEEIHLENNTRLIIDVKDEDYNKVMNELDYMYHFAAGVELDKLTRTHQDFWWGRENNDLFLNLQETFDINRHNYKNFLKLDKIEKYALLLAGYIEFKEGVSNKELEIILDYLLEPLNELDKKECKQKVKEFIYTQEFLI